MLTSIETGMGRGYTGVNTAYTGLESFNAGSGTPKTGFGRGFPGANITYTGLESVKPGTKGSKAGKGRMNTGHENCNPGTASHHADQTAANTIDLDRTPGFLRTDLVSKGKKRMIADEEESDTTDENATISDAESTSSANEALALKRRTQTYATMAQQAARRAKKQKTAAETDRTLGEESLGEWFEREVRRGNFPAGTVAAHTSKNATRTHESTRAGVSRPRQPPPPAAPAAPAAPRPAKLVQTKANSHKFDLHDPKRAKCVCGLCGLAFTRRETLRYTHFNGCARRRGNPRGLAWDAHPSCWMKGATGPSGRRTAAHGHDVVAAADPSLPAPKVSGDPRRGPLAARDGWLTVMAQKKTSRWDQHANTVHARQAAAARRGAGKPAGRASRGMAPSDRTVLGQIAFGARQPAGNKRKADDAMAADEGARKRVRTSPAPLQEPRPAGNRDVVDLTADTGPESPRPSGDPSEAGDSMPDTDPPSERPPGDASESGDSSEDDDSSEGSDSSEARDSLDCSDGSEASEPVEVIDLTVESDPPSEQASGDSSERGSRGWWEVAQSVGYDKSGDDDGESSSDSDEDSDKDEEAAKVSPPAPTLFHHPLVGFSLVRLTRAHRPLTTSASAAAAPWSTAGSTRSWRSPSPPTPSWRRTCGATGCSSAAAAAPSRRAPSRAGGRSARRARAGCGRARGTCSRGGCWRRRWWRWGARWSGATGPRCPSC